MVIGVHTATGRHAAAVCVVWGSKTERGPVQIQNLQRAGQIVQVVPLKYACANWGYAHNHVVLVSKKTFKQRKICCTVLKDHTRTSHGSTIFLVKYDI